jgi:hypothetical protein
MWETTNLCIRLSQEKSKLILHYKSIFNYRKTKKGFRVIHVTHIPDPPASPLDLPRHKIINVIYGRAIIWYAFWLRFSVQLLVNNYQILNWLSYIRNFD